MSGDEARPSVYLLKNTNQLLLVDRSNDSRGSDRPKRCFLLRLDNMKVTYDYMKTSAITFIPNKAPLSSFEEMVLECNNNLNPLR